MTTRPQGASPAPPRSFLVACAAVVLASGLACAPPAPAPEPAPSPADVATEAAALPPAPFALRRPVCISRPAGEILLVGADAGEARDVLVRPSSAASPVRLVVVTDAALGGPDDDVIRGRVADGAILFVDDWGGDAEHLLRFLPGGKVRDLGADEPPLVAPHRLGGVPVAHGSAHNAGATRIVGVEAGGSIRAVATAQDTLCHGCSCTALPGRRAFAENLVAFAVAATASPRASSPAPVTLRGASLAGTAFRVAADFQAPPALAATAHLELVALTGQVLGDARAELAPGTSRPLELEVALTPPLDVLDHRVVATLTTEAAVVRDVRPLVALVGAADLRVAGADSLRAGGPGTVRVILSNSLRGDPVAGAPLALRLADGEGRVIAHADGVSDDAGTASLVLQVPADAPARARLTAEARPALGAERIDSDVTITKRLAAQVLCDLPVHRPGDDAGVRALLVEQPSGRPAASRRVRFELSQDGKVLGERASAVSDAYGAASATLHVPADAGPADCRVVLADETGPVAFARLRVERFETPTFQVTLSPAAPRWTPGRDIPVTFACTRFDGHPLADASLSVELRSGTSGALPLFSWEGRTDAQGAASVTVAVPKSAARAPEYGSRGDGLMLVAVARDAGGREVRTRADVAFGAAGDTRETNSVIAPDGALAPGRPGRVLVRTSREQGATVQVAVGSGLSVAHVVDEFGLVEVRVEDVKPGDKLSIDGVKHDLPVADVPLSLAVARRVVPAGGRVAFSVATTESASAAFVDLVRDGVVVATQTVAIAAHVGLGEFRLPDAVAGPVAIHAYVVASGGGDLPALLGDARVVLVVPREALRATVTPSRAEVAPGETLDLAVDVTDAGGRGTPAIVAVRVADEAVLSLAAAEPECARMVLALDDDVRRATRTIGGRTASGVASLAAMRALTASEQRVADALFALLDRAVGYALDAVTLPSRVAAYPGRVREVLHGFAAALPERLRAVLTGPLAPRPDAKVEDVVQAMRAAEAAGAFGTSGLVDPWGAPLDVEVYSGRIRAGSVGPDSVRDTADDCEEWLDAEATRKLHADWLGAHGVPLDDAAFEKTYVSRFAGRGGHGGGGFGQGGGGGSGGSSKGVAKASRPSVRMRRLFPAALLWSPALLTDSAGRAVVSLRAPDSLTTWRVDVVASDKDGHAADASAEFVTSQPFAIESDPPPAMLVGDEIEVPAILRWTRPLATSASVEAEVSREGKLLSAKTFDVPLGEAGECAASVRVRAVAPGAMSICLRAGAGDCADAVERVITVLPAGRGVVRCVPVTVTGGAPAARASVERFDRSVAGSDRAELRIVASPVGAVLDGVEGMLAKPHGCFEQTSSALYPDVLALRYLRRVRGSSPDVEARFESAIDDGIARLLSFEIEGGGFDWFGRPPAKPLLTAYGLDEWTDIAEVTPTAGAVVRRTAAWLASIQRGDGSFPLDDAPYHWVREAKGATAATAYVAWALARSGEQKDAVGRAVAWLRPRLATEKDPYALALAVAALAETDRADTDALAAASRLAAMARREKDAMRFDAPAGSALHGRRDAASVEATAIAALAAIRLSRPDVLPAEPLLVALARDRQADGTWGTTQATVLALRALLLANVATDVSPSTLKLRGQGHERVIEIRPDERDLVKVVDVTEMIAARGPLVLDASCVGGDLTATLVLRSALPFDVAEKTVSPLRLTAAPDRTACASGDLVTIALRLESKDPAPVAMPLLEVPLPAGFAADAASLETLRGVPGVERVESDTRSVVIYLRELSAAAPFTANVGIRPRLRGRMTAPPASASPYYEADARVSAPPATFTVK